MSNPKNAPTVPELLRALAVRAEQSSATFSDAVLIPLIAHLAVDLKMSRADIVHVVGIIYDVIAPSLENLEAALKESSDHSLESLIQIGERLVQQGKCPPS